jgi:hypothetical protein
MNQRWPTYEVADDEVVRALGVMNINYVRFERTHVWMLAATANLTKEQAVIFVSRTNPNERATFIDTSLSDGSGPSPLVPPSSIISRQCAFSLKTVTLSYTEISSRAGVMSPLSSH